MYTTVDNGKLHNIHPSSQNGMISALSTDSDLNTTAKAWKSSLGSSSSLAVGVVI
jgi:hypothetical protein